MADPALPWAHTADTAVADGAVLQAVHGAVKDQCSQADDFLTLEAAGVAVGGRVEVKWQIETDDGEPYARWWGATVVGPSEERDAELPGAPVYELAYDAHGDFEQERSHVIFVGEHTLRQLDQTEELAWRREGDTWEDEEEDEDEGDQADGEAVVTMDDMRQMASNEKEYLNGKTLEEAEREVLGSMEPNKRIQLAAGFRDFADNLM
ncbi:hypothetical protein GPECTOR_14g51 [Gonium pectorale]|uniref:Uncharacterized protein n=1 Tax=Gonium pectorale TaxID=33097 RepID=A0A150GMH7_GONPE|nr:hypothetical protein GPECTOR_14g51 [Gonium pectorale]|eukprot:KXZ51066.1 hypothetical protein GPECTOR_14g51 [Gonium pectorale]